MFYKELLLGFHIFIAFLKLEREQFSLMPDGIIVEVYQFPSFLRQK